MKKRMMMLTAVLLCGALLTACGGNTEAESTSLATQEDSSAEAEAEESEESSVKESETAAVDEDETTVAGENETAVAGENMTSVAGGNETSVVGENATSVVGGNETSVVGGNETSVAGENETASVGEEEEPNATSEAASAIVDEALRDPVLTIPTIDGEFTLEDCVRLGDYKNLKLDMEINEVTEEDIDRYFSYMVQPMEVEDEAAVLAEGDTANLDFTGYLNDEAFSGGTGTDYDLEIGSGTFIPGFEDQMVGMTKGEERDLELTFPDNYASADLAGQDVVFHVKLNAIKRMPEIDDDWAKAYSDGEYETLDALREATRADLEEQNRSYAETNLQNEAWNMVVESSEVLSFPEILLQEKRDEYAGYLESEAQIYGMTAAEYIEQMGMTQEDFAQINEVQVRTEVENEMLLDAVTEAEGVTEEDPDYQAELIRLTETYNMTADELKETYGEDVLDRHLKSLVAIDKILSYAEITEKIVSAE